MLMSGRLSASGFGRRVGPFVLDDRPAVREHPKARAGEPPAAVAEELDFDAGEAESIDPFGELVRQKEPRIEERSEKHVPGAAGGEIEVETFHGGMIASRPVKSDRRGGGAG